MNGKFNINALCRDLLIDDAFYGFFMFNFNKIENIGEGVTAGVRLSGTTLELLYNPKFFNELKENYPNNYDKWWNCVLKHEMMHVIFKHLTDFWQHPEYNHKLLNIAMDMEINQYIDWPSHDEFIHLDNFKSNPLIGHYFSNVKEKAGTTTYYRVLCIIQEEGSGEEKDELYKIVFSKKRGNDVENECDSGPENEILENSIAESVRLAAEQTEKESTQLPSEIYDKIKLFLKKKKEVFDWKKFFRRIMGNAFDIYSKRTHRRESRRFSGATGTQLKKKHRVLVAVDTSGSVSKKELEAFASEILYIKKSGTDVDLINCDTDIRSCVKVESIDDILKMAGGGGTIFDPVIDYFNKNKKNYTTLIFFTDGYAPKDHLKPEKKMIWVLTPDCDSSEKYPGYTVKIPRENTNE